MKNFQNVFIKILFIFSFCMIGNSFAAKLPVTKNKSDISNKNHIVKKTTPVKKTINKVKQYKKVEKMVKVNKKNFNVKSKVQKPIINKIEQKTITKPVSLQIKKNTLKEETEKQVKEIFELKPVKSDEPIKKIDHEYLESYLEKLNSSFNLFELIINSHCGNPDSNCNTEKQTELAKSILKDMKEKYPSVNNLPSEDEIKFLLLNSNTLKNKTFVKTKDNIEAKNNTDKPVLSEVKSKINEPEINTTKSDNIIIENTVPIVTYVTKTPDLLSSTLSPDQSKVVFVSERDGNPEIYVMNSDSSNQLRLTNNEDYDLMPGWSPDGTKIVFISERDGNPEIYVMNSDGSNQTRLTSNSSYDYSPAWSPDGTKIIFVSNRNLQYEKDGLFKISFRIYVMDSDGSNQVLLSNESIEDESPKWSPDGTKISFVSNRDGNSEIYVMNSDGTNIKRLTDNKSADLMPNWSPDSNRLAFRSDRDGNPEIYVMNADGTNQLRLTNNKVADEYPCWTSDGTKITYVSKRDKMIDNSGSSTYEIYMMNPDGSNIDRLTKNDFNDYFPSWSKT